MQNLSSGAVNKSTSLPVWDLNSLQNFAVNNTKLDGAALVLNNTNSSFDIRPIINYGIEGLTLSNHATIATHLTVAAGSCMSSIGFVSLMTLSGTLTKRLDQTWVAGDSSGGRFTGVSLSNTTYHVFVIRNLTTGVVDVGFDTSVVAANRPSGWSARRIGSILRISASIAKFTQLNTLFLHGVVRIDLDGVAIPSTDTLYTMTVPTGIPVTVSGILSPGIADINTSLSIEMKSPGKTGIVPNLAPIYGAFRGMTGSYFYYGYGNGDSSYDSPVCFARALTNNSSQVSFRTTGSYYHAINCATFQTHSWDDSELLKGR